MEETVTQFGRSEVLRRRHIDSISPDSAPVGKEVTVRRGSSKNIRVRYDDVCSLSRDGIALALRELHEARVAGRRLRKARERTTGTSDVETTSENTNWNSFRPEVRNLFHDVSEEGLKVFLNF